VIVRVSCDRSTAPGCQPGERHSFAGESVPAALAAARAAGWRLRGPEDVCPACVAIAAAAAPVAP
jgi:hypothetical protein